MQVKGDRLLFEESEVDVVKEEKRRKGV